MRSDWVLAAEFALGRWNGVRDVRRVGCCLACLHAHQGGTLLAPRLVHHHDEPVFRVTLHSWDGPDHFVRVERGKASVHCHESHGPCHSPLG